MATKNNLPTNDNFEEWLYAELYRAYLDARKGKRGTADEHKFELNDFTNLYNLRESIINRTYAPSRGITFLVHRPVIREIFAAPFRDRVVHHFLYNVSNDWFDSHFVESSFSCRKKKGTLYAQQTLAKHVRRATKNYTKPAFVVKIDLRGYFMSLERRKLYQLVVNGLDQQFADHKGKLYHTAKFLWHQIIFDDPTRGVKVRGSIKGWRKLPRDKSLFTKHGEHGIVIGNLTSQLMSNIMLNQLDRFITMKLGYKYYGRYVDDAYIVVPQNKKPQLLRDIKVIEKYLREELHLTMHPKKRFAGDTKKGIEFLGAVIYEGYIVPGKRIKRNCRSAFRKCAEGRGDPDNIVSYLGHLSHINSKKFLKKAFDELGWEYRY